MIRVGNARTGDKGVYIGRPCRGLKGSPLHNPFKIGDGETRESSVAKYKEYLHEQIVAGNRGILQELAKIREAAKQGDVTLVCWCSPLACHGHVIVEYLQNEG